MSQQGYNFQTVKAVRFLLADLLKKNIVKTGDAQKIIEANSHLNLRPSSIANIFSLIMDDYVKAGRAMKIHRGCWQIAENNCGEPEVVVPLLSANIDNPKIPKKWIEEAMPVKFDPSLNAWLNPPKDTKHVEIYEQLKSIKDKSKFCDMATKLCYEMGVPIKRLINYINEQRQVRYSERAGT